jgi:hypothetical protein
MAAITSGVYPVYENQFKINTKGREGGETNLVTIADMESFSVSFGDNVEEWTPMTTEGWVRRLKTGKGVTITIAGKRNVGDAGNDYVAGLAFKSGQTCNSQLEWNFPNGDKVLIDCVINVTSAGGDSTNVEPLEFECLSDGKPTFTAA